MDLALNPRQQMLQATARDFVKQQAPKDVLVSLDKQGVSFSPEIWQQVASLGWLGALIPKEYGGEGTPLLDTAVIYEELGRGPVPGPFFESGVLCALTILEGGTEEQKRTLLPAIARGQRILALATMDPSPRWGPESVHLRAEARNGGFVLNGVKPFVHYAGVADAFLVAARTAPRGADPQDGITFLVVDRHAPGVEARDLGEGTMTGFGEVSFTGVEVPDAAVLGQPGQGWRYLERALLRALPVLSAYQVGGLETVCELAITYSQIRIVFGQPIGRFQRVQDRIVEAVNFRDAARWTTYEAIWKLETDRPAASSVHLAKSVASEGYYEATNLSTEVHAGIGIEPGTGLNIHIKMSRGLYSYLGDPRYHRRRMIDALGL